MIQGSAERQKALAAGFHQTRERVILRAGLDYLEQMPVEVDQRSGGAHQRRAPASAASWSGWEPIEE